MDQVGSIIIGHFVLGAAAVIIDIDTEIPSIDFNC